MEIPLRKSLLALGWLFGAWLNLHAADTPSDLKIYLLIGQSNMAGRAPMEEGDTAPIPNAFLFTAKGAWEPASNPLNRHSSTRKALDIQQVNPGYGFLLEMDPPESAPIGLVVNARGGTNIDRWVPGERLYDESVKRALQAQESGEIVGVLWHQGEANANDPEYLDKLVTLVENLRKDLNAPELPFVAGQVLEGTAVNDLIAQLPEKLPHTAYVSSDALVVMDRWHFDRPSMLELGRRYGIAMKQLQAEE